jgi:hypothetical protein
MRPYHPYLSIGRIHFVDLSHASICVIDPVLYSTISSVIA